MKTNMYCSLIFNRVLCLSNKNVFTRFSLAYKHKNQPLQDIFAGEKDRFKGLTIDSKKQKCNENNFLNKLEDSLSEWTSQGHRCIWFQVNIKQAFWVPILAQKGFNFHHAREDYVIMYKWLPVDCEANLPPACHTNLGVGAMVLNKNNQILAISERHYEYPHWKLPGGYVEKGEDIIDAGVREVREETGVEAEFQSLITLRHSHNMMYGNSDVYFLMMMKAVTDKIILSQREIKDCKWMDVDEYTNHPHVHKFNRLIVQKALDYRNKKLKLDIKKQTVQWPTAVREMNFLILEDCEY